MRLLSYKLFSLISNKFFEKRISKKLNHTKNHDYCPVEMPKNSNDILKYKHVQK